MHNSNRIINNVYKLIKRKINNLKLKKQIIMVIIILLLLESLVYS